MQNYLDGIETIEQQGGKVSANRAYVRYCASFSDL